MNILASNLNEEKVIEEAVMKPRGKAELMFKDAAGGFPTCISFFLYATCGYG